MDVVGQISDVCMNRTKENGTHTYDMWDYADKWVLVTYEETPSTVYNVCHNYTTPGQYNVTLRCYNRYSYFSEKKLIYVQYPILNLNASSEMYNIYGDDVVINWSYEYGTEVDVTATLDGTDITNRIIFNDADNRAGNITNPGGVSDNEPGIHTVVITCSNLVSGSVTTEVVYYVEKTITGLSFTANGEDTLLYVRTATDVTVVATVTDGSHIMYTYNNGIGDVTEVTADNSDTTFSAYQYTTSEDNYYMVTMEAKNNVSNDSASMIVVAENPLTSDITFTNTNETDATIPVTFTITPTNSGDPEPTNIVASFKYGDEGSDTYTDADVDISLIPSSSTPHTRTHIYNYGRYVAEVFIKNNVSNLTLQTNVMVGEAIVNFQMQLVEANNCFDPESPVQFTVSRSQGTNITHTYDWDHVTESDTTQQMSFTKSHTFPSDGFYDVVATAMNVFDNVASSLTVKMVHDFPASINMTADMVVDMASPNCPIEITRSANEYSPTNATCTIYKDGNSEAQFDLDLGSDHTQPGSFSFNWDVSSLSLGPTDYSLNCSTCNEDVSWTKTVFLQTFITNLQVSIDHTAATPAQNVCVTLTVDTGSHVTFLAHFGENLTVIKYDEAAKTAELCHAYDTDGNHTIEVKVMNPLGNLTDSIDTIIQYPVTTLQLDERNGQEFVAIPSGGSVDLTFDLRIANGPTEGPTDTFCSWSAYEGATVNVMYAPELKNLQNHTNTLTYLPSEPIGHQTVNVTCSNLVSRMSAQVNLVLQIPCTSAELRNSTNPVGLNKNITYTVLLQPTSPQKCSHVWVFYDFGDGNTGVQYYDGILDSDPSIVHSYIEENTYSVRTEVWNLVTKPNLTDSLVEDVTVLKSLVFEDFHFTYVSPLQWPATVSLNVSTDFEYIDTSVKFIWGINGQETIVSDATWPVERQFTYSGANDVKGNVTLSVVAENSVSDVEWNGTLVIKQAPSGTAISLDDHYRTNEAISGEVTLAQGTHLTLEVTCSAVDGATGCSNPYTESTDNSTIIPWPFPLSFSQPGKYDIQCKVSNEFGEDTATKRVVIQNRIEGFTVRSEDDPNYVNGDSYQIPFLGIDTKFTMLFEVTNDCAFPPTDVMMNISVDYPRDLDNVTTHNVSALNCLGTPFPVTRKYEEIGDYAIKSTVYNQISEASYTVYLKVLDPVDDNFNITVEPIVEPDEDGVPWYPLRSTVNITAAHGALAEYTHTYFWSFNCDDDNNPVGAYSENCQQDTEYASTQDIFVNNIFLEHSGIYRMMVMLTYPGVDPTYSTKKIGVEPVPEFRIRIEIKNPDNTWSELSLPLTKYDLKDIKAHDFRFTSLHDEVATGSWTIRWFIDGKEVLGSPTVDAPFEANGNTYFAAPGVYEIQAKLDGLPDLTTAHNQLFSSAVVELEVVSSVGICDIQLPASGFLNEKFTPSDSFPCALEDPQYCLVIFKLCEPLKNVPTCFKVTIEDPDNQQRFSKGYQNKIGGCPGADIIIIGENIVLYDRIDWPDDLSLDKIGTWTMTVETAETITNNNGDDETKSEVSDKVFEIKCRPCFAPVVTLRNPQGEGSSVNNTKKYPRCVVLVSQKASMLR